MKGRIAVITGANDGLGLASAKALAGAGAHVVMAARNQEKARRALESIVEAHPGALIEIVRLDLGSLESVASAAALILANHPTVHLLMNNAGLMALPERRTADGFEMQFGVNHLGHWALTAHLLPGLVRSSGARVVTMTSFARYFGRRVDPANPHLEGRYDPWAAYSQSKLANYHFALGLEREFRRNKMDARSLAAHPGLTASNLQTHSQAQGAAGPIGAIFHKLASTMGMDPDYGALSQLRAAADPEASGSHMYGPRFSVRGVPVRRPLLRRIGLESAIDNLWRVSERETGINLGFAAR